MTEIGVSVIDTPYTHYTYMHTSYAAYTLQNNKNKVYSFTDWMSPSHARPTMIEILVVKLVRASTFPGGTCPLPPLLLLQPPYTMLTNKGICPHHPCLVSLLTMKWQLNHLWTICHPTCCSANYTVLEILISVNLLNVYS